MTIDIDCLSIERATPRILLVDDERDITEVLGRGLEQNGLSVDVFNDPEKALENFKPNYYDCNVLDIRMPRMNGFDLAQAIWQEQTDAQVCFLTAFEIYENEADKVFKDLNTKCFLKKPLRASELAQHVQTHIAARQ
jgi:DNA-binding response OmpR family regulator